MQLTNFFASVASKFRDRYLSLANITDNRYSPTTKQNKIEPEEPTVKRPTDSYEPSAKLPDRKNDTEKVHDKKPHHTENKSDKKQGHNELKPRGDESEVEKTPEGTYYRRDAKLKYKLGLQFDMNSIIATASRLSDGETKAAQEFAAAGFGLRADFAIKGKQTIETNGAENESGESTKLKIKARSNERSFGAYSAQTRGFNVDAFRKESLDIRRSLKVENEDNHRRAVNKFSFRLKVDSGFSFSYANRFNAQTKEVAEQSPEQVGRYLENAGNLAAGGSTEMMGTFFDAVDSYLQGAEESLIEKTVAAFDQAAAELGFEGSMVDGARESLISNIEGFFDRVESALDNAEQFFGTNSTNTAAAVPDNSAQIEGNGSQPNQLSTANLTQQLTPDKTANPINPDQALQNVLLEQLAGNSAPEEPAR